MAVEKIDIDLTSLKGRFPGVTDDMVDALTETCVKMVASAVYTAWEGLAKKNLRSTADIYVNGLKVVDKGRLSKQIVLTGTLPEMIEEGANPFDMKEGFKKSQHVRYTVARYNAKGKQVYAGGDWYLTIPFRQGTPGIVGQQGFANEMPAEIYSLMVHRAANKPLTIEEIPSPYDIPRSRAEIRDKNTGKTLFPEYQHKNSIYEGLMKKSAAYNKVIQNTYVSFRRAGERSDENAWIHKGIAARRFMSEAVQKVDAETMVTNEVYEFLDKVLGT